MRIIHETNNKICMYVHLMHLLDYILDLRRSEAIHLIVKHFLTPIWISISAIYGAVTSKKCKSQETKNNNTAFVYEFDFAEKQRIEHLSALFS